MEEWGNARANAYYEAKLPRDYQKPRENDPVRVVEKFIREKYEQKRFIADSIPPPNSSGEIETSAAAPVKEVRRPVIQAAPSPAPQRTVPASAPAKVVPKEEPNLLDFFDSPAPPPPPVQSAPVHVTPQQDPFGGFGQPSQPANSFFTSTPVHQDPFAPPAATAAPAQHFQDPFFGGGGAQQHPPQSTAPQQFQDPFFGTPTPAVQTQFGQAPPQQPQAPKASADAILSLYSTPQHQGGMQHGGGQGISMMMPPPNVGMGMGPPRGMPGPMGYGQPPYGGMPGMYPPQQPQYPMMGQMPQPGYPPQQQYPPRGMAPGPGFQQPNVGFGMVPQHSQGMYPNQQRW
jgi:hypothetical protein